MKIIYALIWKQSSSSQKEFDERTPALLEWLHRLRREGQLRGCGEWLNADGGLTLIEAGSIEEAQGISASGPLSDIGTTEIFVWSVYHADLVVEGIP